MSALRHSSENINIGKCKPEPVNPGAVMCSHDFTCSPTQSSHRLCRNEDRQEMNLQKPFLGSREQCERKTQQSYGRVRPCRRLQAVWGSPSLAECCWKCVLGSPGLVHAPMATGWLCTATGPATSSGGFAVLGFPALWRNRPAVLQAGILRSCSTPTVSLPHRSNTE